MSTKKTTQYKEDLSREKDELSWKLDRLDTKNTGLSMNVWVRTKYPTDDVNMLGTPRVYIGDAPENKYAVSIDAVPVLLDGLSKEEIGITELEFTELSSWIYANRAALLDYWYGRISTCDLVFTHFPYTGGDSFFEVEKVVVEPLPERCRQHYPSYKLHSYERAVCKSLVQAEDVMTKYVEKYREDHPKDWCEDLFCYYIKEYPMGAHITQSDNYLLSWRLYNENGEMIDRSLCCGLDANDAFNEFEGRDNGQFRFKKGDIVEFIYRKEVRLGFVSAIPPSRDWVKRKKEEWASEERGYMYSFDISDDSYIVLTSSDYASHYHVSSMDIFAPHYYVPNYMRKKLELSYQRFLERLKDEEKKFKL